MLVVLAGIGPTALGFKEVVTSMGLHEAFDSNGASSQDLVSRTSDAALQHESKTSITTRP